MFHQTLGDIWEVIDDKGRVRSLRRTERAALERAQELEEGAIETKD